MHQTAVMFTTTWLTVSVGPVNTQQYLCCSRNTHSAGCWDRWGGWCWWHGRTHTLDPCSPGSAPAVVKGKLRCPGNQTKPDNAGSNGGRWESKKTCYRCSQCVRKCPSIRLWIESKFQNNNSNKLLKSVNGKTSKALFRFMFSLTKNTLYDAHKSEIIHSRQYTHVKWD